MKIKVSDSAVAEYVTRIRAKIPLGTLFPAPMSDCDFTDQQRQIIREARTERKRADKRLGVQTGAPAKTNSLTAAKPAAEVSPTSKPGKLKSLKKLQKMLYLQSGRCFFCGELLREEDASIEHLIPKSLGGFKAENNEVVCHASLNETFGAMDVKRKFEFVLKSAGAFSCPET